MVLDMTITIKTVRSSMSDPHALKHFFDIAALFTAFSAFFKTIPWPEIAAFLSCLWLITRLYEYVKAKIQHKKFNGDA